MAEPRPVLEMTGIVKEFPGVRALSGVDFRLFPGEIHALMGENGAGKSTLIKVLTGVYSLDGGTITLDGEPVRFASPLQAQQAGVNTVYQEVNLCPNLSVAENIFIGREPTRFGRIQWKLLRKEAAELVDRLGLDIDVTAPLSSYPLAVQQLVAIVRSVGTGDGVGSRHQGARPRRADVQPRPRRGPRTLPADAAVEGRGGRDPLRLALPRPDLRDLRPHDRPAQRHPRRRAHGQRTRPGRPDPADDRQGPGPAGGAPRAPAARRRRRDPAARGRPRPHGRRRPLRPGHQEGRGRGPRPACSVRAAPNSPGCSSAPTSPTAARSPWAASRSR